MKRNYGTVKVLTAVLTAAMFFAVSCATGAAYTETEHSQASTVSVSGTGSVSLEADMVSFSINVSNTAPTTGEAQQETNRKIGAILDILRSYKIEDRDITTTSINFSTDYYWENGKQIKNGEQVSQSLYVRLRNIDSFGSLIDDIGSNVSGISFYSVSFDASDRTEALIKVRELAYQDAYEKAFAYAQSAGMRLGRPISISDGYTATSTRNTVAEGKVMAMASAAVEDFYQTETPTGSLNVSVTVNIIFELE